MTDLHRLLGIAATAALLAASLSAQAPQTRRKQVRKPPPPAPVQPAAPPVLVALTVDGAVNYTREQVLEIAQIKTGMPATKELFEAARDRLVSSGLFETVGYRFAPLPDRPGMSGSLQIVEVEPMYAIRFEGLGLDPKIVNQFLRKRDIAFTGKLPATKQAMDRYVQWLEEFLAERGKPEKMAAKVAPGAKDDFTILFRPARPGAAVAEVRFDGNQVLSLAALLSNFGGVAFGTIYTEPDFRRLLDTGVRPLYEAKGKLRVAFPKVNAEKAKTVEGVVVSVEVDEGPTFKMGPARFSGLKTVDAADMRRVAALKPDVPANFDEVNAAMERIRERLGKEGLIKSAVEMSRQIDDKARTVAVTYAINEGPQYLFDRVAYVGLDIHGEAAVKKLWGMKPGSPFNAGYPDYFLRRIREDGLFDSLGKTRAKLDVDEKNLMVSVTLHFK